MVLERLDLYLNYIKQQELTQVVQKVKYFLLVGNKLDTGIQLISDVLVDTKADTNLIIQHVRREFFEPIKNGNYLTDFVNFSRQTAITQAEKLVFSFFACCSISLIRLCGKRIAFVSDLLFIFPVAIICNLYPVLVFRHYTAKNKDKKGLTCYYTY